MASRGGLESSRRCLSQSGTIKLAPIGMGCSDKHTGRRSSCSAQGPPGAVRVRGTLRRRSPAPHLCPSRHLVQLWPPAPPTSALPGTACSSEPPAAPTSAPPAPPAALRPRGPHLCTSRHRLQLCVPARGTPVARTSAPLHPLAAVAPAPFPPAPGPPSAQDPGAGRPGLALHHPRRVRPRRDQGPPARATPGGGGPEMATRVGARSSESHQRCQLSDSRGFPDALGSSFVVLGEMELFRHIWERDWEWGGMIGSRVEFWTRTAVVGLDWATGGHQVALKGPCLTPSAIVASPRLWAACCTSRLLERHIHSLTSQRANNPCDFYNVGIGSRSGSPGGLGGRCLWWLLEPLFPVHTAASIPTSPALSPHTCGLPLHP